jgi:dTDP-4-amino-4,6-dideoxygalactose transaminase
MLDLSPEIELLWPELTRALEEVVRSGRFILGPQVAGFESEVASWLGASHALALNSGTDALVIALDALGIGPGDEVVTSAFSFFATAEAISRVGASPVFADIERDTFNLDPASVEKSLTPKTRALLPVHLFGQAAEMDALTALAQRHDLQIVEDTAQAFGGRYRGRRLGTLGHAGAFSFYPSKNLGAYGDGGLLVTNDEELATRVRKLRDHGSRSRYYHDAVGYNSRLDEIQAAILRIKLPHVDAWNERRREAAARYREMLGGLPRLIVPEERDPAHHVFHQYTVRIGGGRRDAVQQALSAAEVASVVYYPEPLHRSRPYAAKAPSLPEAETAAAEVLSLPMGPELDATTQERIAATIRSALDS